MHMNIYIYIFDESFLTRNPQKMTTTTYKTLFYKKKNKMQIFNSFAITISNNNFLFIYLYLVIYKEEEDEE